jgi:hypothetical protein
LKTFFARFDRLYPDWGSIYRTQVKKWQIFPDYSELGATFGFEIAFLAIFRAIFSLLASISPLESTRAVSR